MGFWLQTEPVLEHPASGPTLQSFQSCKPRSPGVGVMLAAELTQRASWWMPGSSREEEQGPTRALFLPQFLGYSNWFR